MTFTQGIILRRLRAIPRCLKCISRRSSSGSQRNPEEKQEHISFDHIPVNNIRSFSITAHVDHGKSTLADRLMEITGLLSPDSSNKQVLDRERGITVKAQTVSLVYNFKGEDYLLNLIDTPGHVDFSSEVSRSLIASQAVVLLIDANQGIQAQTVSNYYLAKSKGLVIIPVLNKIDLKTANPAVVCSQIKTIFGIEPETILKISAKVGTGVEEVLKAVIERVPPPQVDRSGPFRGILFDSWFDRYRGVIGLIYVKDGQVKLGDTIKSSCSQKKYGIRSLSVLRPDEVATGVLVAGQVGCISCSMRSISEAYIGDVLVEGDKPICPDSTFKSPQPMVFAGVYPFDQSEHLTLRNAIEKLTLNDKGVTVSVDSSPSLGQGWRVGFLGLLHLEVFVQRLEQEYGAEAIITSPSVTYKVLVRGKKTTTSVGGTETYISNPAQLPDSQNIVDIQEPVVLGTIITPDIYLGEVLSLCAANRGVQKSAQHIDNTRVMIQFFLPLNEIVFNFHDSLKSCTSGFGSFDYENYGYASSDLVRMDILLNGKQVNELSTIVHSTKIQNSGKAICAKLVEVIPRQQFQVAIQAKVGGKIIARETLKAYRKDVTGKLKSGGDKGRRMKLLKRQSEGKERLKSVGNISLPRSTFIEILKK